MPARRRRRGAPRSSADALRLVLWLLPCLLLAQWAGLAHRIQHAGWQTPGLAAPGLAAWHTPSIAGPAHTTADGDAAARASKTHHACVLFDAAASGDLHGQPGSALVLTQGRPCPQLALGWRWPDLPLAPAFLTRAPPQTRPSRA